jgi:cytochrome c553
MRVNGVAQRQSRVVKGTKRASLSGRGMRLGAAAAAYTFGVFGVFGAFGAIGVLAGCGSHKGAEDASAYAPKSETPWKEMSREQRMDWMAVAVFPEMRKLFQAQDAEKYDDFACQTCHGREMERVDFKMPNDLFALEKVDTVAKAKDYDEKTTDFMLGGVVPEMAQLLGRKPYTIESGKGYGCIGCHPTAKP